ncbi:MAG: hypothetical protein P4L81_01505 [Candidatus Pacebacteria bacterium]|nr:hypothetical protein [Candidatus Paceibacterota bacterium]
MRSRSHRIRGQEGTIMFMAFMGPCPLPGPGPRKEPTPRRKLPQKRELPRGSLLERTLLAASIVGLIVLFGIPALGILIGKKFSKHT